MNHENIEKINNQNHIIKTFINTELSGSRNNSLHIPLVGVNQTQSQFSTPSETPKKKKQQQVLTSKLNSHDEKQQKKIEDGKDSQTSPAEKRFSKKNKICNLTFTQLSNHDSSNNNMFIKNPDVWYPEDINDRFAWNTFALQPLIQLNICRELIIPIICGGFKLRVIELDNRFLHIGVISRRSRFYVGARYLRRGIDDYGNVANEVETEMFLQEIDAFDSKVKLFSSYTMIRGSIPFFWGHTKIGFSIKPDIFINKQKDPKFHATNKHFDRLLKTYNGPVFVLN